MAEDKESKTPVTAAAETPVAVDGASVAGAAADADQGTRSVPRETSPTNAEILSRIARDAEEGAGGRSADRMADRLIDDLSSDPQLGKKLERSPELVRDFADVAKLSADAAILRQYDLEIIKSNGQLYLTVVRCVGASLVLVVIAIAGLAFHQLTMMGTPVQGTITIAVPDGLIALGSAAIGALAGLLTPLSGRR